MLWTARVVWIVLPFTTGAAYQDVMDSWSHAPRIVAAVLLWAAWFGGLVALLAPRPWGFTTLRIVAPAATAVAVVSAWSASAPAATLAIVGAALATVASLSAPVANAAAASTAYGPERRFPLRAPLALLAGPLPLSVALITAGIAAGPLLLASGHIVGGVVTVVVGAPIAALLVRSLATLDRRWIVLVPAGLVVVDPLSFPDAVLLPREQIASLARVPIDARDRDESEILVGGPGPLLLRCREPGAFLRRSGRGREEIQADRLRLAPLRPAAVLAAAGAHRIAVG